MLRAIYDFIASDYYDPVMSVLLTWGLVSLGVLLLGRHASRPIRVFAWAGVAALGLSVVFSMVFEDFLPGLQSGRTGVDNAIGMSAILAGAVAVVVGGYVFVRDTFARLGAAAKPRFGRGKAGQEARGLDEIEPVPVAGWLAVWSRGLLWLAGGFLLIIVGASLNNENRFPLAWLWRGVGL